MNTEGLEVWGSKQFSSTTLNFILNAGLVTCTFFGLFEFLTGDVTGSAILMLVMVGLLLARVVYNLSDSVTVSLQMVGFSAFAGVVLLSYNQGGLDSPTLWWLVVVPLCFIVCGRYFAACFWMAMACITVLVFLLEMPLGSSGLPRSMQSSSEFYALVMIGLFIVVIIFIVLVETSRHTAFQKLEKASAGLQQTARALELSNHKLVTARDAALEHAATQSRFMANMSHELRTPLNGVLGAVNLLDTSSMNSSQKELVQILKRSGGHLIEIINDVLDYSKLEAGKLTLEATEFSPRNLTEGIANLFRAEANQKGLRLTCRVAADVPEQALADEKRLRQIGSNLVSNAIKFTQQGEVNLDLAVAGNKHDGVVWLALTVTDTGIGISRDEHKKLFDAFYQLDGSLTRTAGGTGLGLTISAELARMMGGYILVSSELGKGSIFTLEVPVQKSDGDASCVRPVLTRQVQSAIVIEPHDLSRMICTELLQQLGIEVVGVGAQLTAEMSEQSLRSGCVVVVDAGVALAAAEEGGAASLAALGDRLLISLPVSGRTELINRLFPAARLLEHPISLVALATAINQGGSEGVDEPDDGESRPAANAARVLVVEDDPINQKLAVSMLEKAGYQADTASNGQQAVDAQREQAYDLILMDCRMPVMDGFEATRQIRQHEAVSGSRPCKIIAVTGDAQSSDRDRCLDAGMDVFISKPYMFEALRAAMEQALRGSS